MLDEMTKKVKEEKEALQCRIRILESGMKDLQFLYDKELEWKPSPCLCHIASLLFVR